MFGGLAAKAALVGAIGLTGLGLVTAAPAMAMPVGSIAECGCYGPPPPPPPCGCGGGGYGGSYGGSYGGAYGGGYGGGYGQFPFGGPGIGFNLNGGYNRVGPF